MPQINIPQEIYDKLKNRAKVKSYADTDSYIISIITEIAKRIQDKNGAKKKLYSKEEESEIKDRLRSFGYID